MLVTNNGLMFTSDASGRVYAFETKTGRELWHDDTGSAIVAPISAYSVDGNEYLVVEAGEAGNQQTPNLPKSQGASSRRVRLERDANGDERQHRATRGRLDRG